MPPVNLILDGDYAGDRDSTGAFLIAIGAHMAGEARILCATDTFGDLASARVLPMMLAMYGLEDIPYGYCATTHPSKPGPYAWAAEALQKWAVYDRHRNETVPGSGVPLATAVIRQALRDAADASVIWNVGGEWTNWWNVYQSPGDDIDPRTGAQLLAAKVLEAHAVGPAEDLGGFGVAFNNWATVNGGASAYNTVENWPTAVRMVVTRGGGASGWTWNLITGDEFRLYQTPNHIGYHAYRLSNTTSPHGYGSMDAVSMHRSLYGNVAEGTTWLNQFDNGRFLVNPANGAAYFDPADDRNHSRTTQAADSATWKARLNMLMNRPQMPSRSLSPVAVFDFRGNSLASTVGTHAGTLVGSPLPTVAGDILDLTGNTGTSEMVVPDAPELRFGASDSFGYIVEALFPSVSATRIQAILYKSRDTTPPAMYGLSLDNSGNGRPRHVQHTGSAFATVLTPTNRYVAADRWTTFVGGQTVDGGAATRHIGFRDRMLVPQSYAGEPILTAATGYAADGTGDLRLGRSNSGTEHAQCRVSYAAVYDAPVYWHDADDVLWKPHSVTTAGNVVRCRMGAQWTGPFVGTAAGFRVWIAGQERAVASVAFSGRLIDLTVGGSIQAGDAVRVKYDAHPGLGGDVVDTAVPAVALRSFEGAGTAAGSSVPASYVLLSRRGTAPSPLANVNTLEPISSALCFLTTPGGVSRLDRVGGGQLILGPAANLQRGTEYGAALDSTSTTSGGCAFANPSPALLRITNKATVAILCTLDGLVNGGRLVCIPYYPDSSWAIPFVAMSFSVASSANASAQFEFSNATGARRVSTATDNGYFLVDGKAHLYVVTWSGSVVRFYRDGLPHGAAKSITNNDAYLTNRGRIHLFQRNLDNPGEGLDGRVNMAAIWGRELSTGEVANLASDPFASLNLRKVYPTSPANGSRHVARYYSQSRFRRS